MKRTAVFFLLAAMFVMCLTGCGGREQYAGKWEAKEMVVNGTSMTELANVPLNVFMRFELEENGSAEWASPIQTVKDPSKSGVSASWKIKDEKIILKVNMPDGENVIEFYDKDGKLVTDQGGSQLYLERVDDFSPVDSMALMNAVSGGNAGSLFGG